MIRWIGSKYGGWHIDIGKIPAGSTVISAGLGNDISFDEALIKAKKCYIVGIDPTNLTKKSIAKKQPLHNFVLIRKALYTGERTAVTTADTNGASIFDGKQKTAVESITLQELLHIYTNTSVLKMNIEGAEYDVIYNAEKLTIPQVLVRFHHRKENVPFTYKDTVACISKMQGFGYRFLPQSDHKDKNVDYEVLFTL